MLYCSRSRGVGSAPFVARVSLGSRCFGLRRATYIYICSGTMLRPNAVVQRRLRRCSSACDGRQSCFSDMACLRRRTLSVTITPSCTSIQIPKTILKKCSGGNDSPIFTMRASSGRASSGRERAASLGVINQGPTQRRTNASRSPNEISLSDSRWRVTIHFTHSFTLSKV